MHILGLFQRHRLGVAACAYNNPMTSRQLKAACHYTANTAHSDYCNRCALSHLKLLSGSNRIPAMRGDAIWVGKVWSAATQK
ncbi:hypothetical protein LMG29739_01976 [Paraburkholderia solisilvae]|uniref:Uncharacterized protein n=1 Tax=Paraburkholderia solisilvae TaxID=624376 RepID=A0A6J5DN41_9BURK|nr:hypothetical protein LMG29739_01976 [Paraburkholderia solisilvae]